MNILLRQNCKFDSMMYITYTLAVWQQWQEKKNFRFRFFCFFVYWLAFNIKLHNRAAHFTLAKIKIKEYQQ